MLALLSHCECSCMGSLPVADLGRLVQTLCVHGNSWNSPVVDGQVAVGLRGLGYQALAYCFRAGCGGDCNIRKLSWSLALFDRGLIMSKLELLHVVDGHCSIEGLLEYTDNCVRNEGLVT